MARLSKAEKLELEAARKNMSHDAGEIVVVKTNTIPHWPGMIISEGDLPKEILDEKPDAESIICILTFAEYKYLWVSLDDVHPLSSDQAVEASKASKIRKALREAYITASANPSYEEHLEASKTPEPAKKTRGSNGNTNKSKKQKVKEEADVEMDDEESSEYVDQTPTEDTDFSSSDHVTEKNLNTSQDSRVKFCAKLREQLQRSYLVETPQDISEQAVADLSKLLEVQELETSVVRRTRLFKVLKFVLACDITPELKGVAKQFVDKFETHKEPIIRGIPEDLAVDEDEDAESEGEGEGDGDSKLESESVEPESVEPESVEPESETPQPQPAEPKSETKYETSAEPEASA